MPDLENMDLILLKDESVFRKHIDKAKHSLSGPKGEQYKKLTTSFEKFKFWRDNYPKWEVQTSRPNKADLKKALELKEEGNKLFKESRLREAREIYTQSLQICPVNYEKPAENKDYAIILANRSATLDQTGPYHACLQDVEMAFKYGYPKEMYFKLYNRKGHALLKLKQHLKSKEAFVACSNWIGKSDMPEKLRDQWHNRMKKQMNVFGCNKKLANVDPPKRPLVDKLQNLKEMIKFNDDKSNVVAVSDILAEDFIHKESPRATVVFDDGPSEGKICPITLTRFAAPVPCSYGSSVVFSSEEARDKANASYHQYEWSILDSLKQYGISAVGRLALRLVTSIAPQDIKKIVAELRGNELKPNEQLSEAASVFALPTHSKMTLENSICVYLLINYFMECLKTGNYISKDLPDLTGDLVFLLARAILVCVEHSTTLTFGDYIDNKADLWNMDKYPIHSYALGIFPKLSLLKSVSVAAAAKTGTGSDVITFFQDEVVIVQSFRTIGPGQPVNLGDEIRGKMEAMMPQDMIPFKCNGKNCGLSFPLHEKTNQNTVNCPSETCGIETNIWQKRRRIVEIRAQYDAVRGELEKSKIRSAINFLHDLILEWDKIVARPYKEFTKLETQLTKAMMLEHVEEEDQWIGFSSHWLRRAK